MRYKFLNQISEKYLVYAIQNWQFAISVNSIVEIIAYSKPEKIPNTWEYIEGILLFKNTVCPVLNLKKKFGIKDVGSPIFRQIIIVYSSYGIIGILSDMVQEIKAYSDVTLYKEKKMVPENIYSFIAGRLKFKDKYIAILDCDKLLEDPGMISFDEIEFSEMLISGSSPDSEGGTINESL